MQTSYLGSFESALKAASALRSIGSDAIDALLRQLADRAVASTETILIENRKDLARMDPNDPRYDRLTLTESRMAAIAGEIRNVADLPSPVGRLLMEYTLPNGLHISKKSVPFGVIGVIYEARPNVTFDVFSLCLKSGNAAVLKGGSDASFTNEAIANLIRRVLTEAGFDANCLTLLPPEREATAALLNARGYVDLIIPRGSQALIDFVRENARIPVIETGAGICHTYFDRMGDREMGREVIFNAKTRRVSVCNALDCLVIHRERLEDLPYLMEPMVTREVEVFADPESLKALTGHYPADLLHEATAASFGTEFLSYKMAIKTVGSLEEALEHIQRYSSKHSEAILSADRSALDQFLNRVDAAAVYANTSTAFTDGAQFGLGAEIGISTQKLHARGPMALEEMTTYKWFVEGHGQVRP
ncbi:MAG: glutamate-5-semialdehyde dehydrogenase [Marinilabiliales bacterium]|nr:glutamate-5-semialdehyde dehydrogenase [Marinilabiliales bacterium]